MSADDGRRPEKAGNDNAGKEKKDDMLAKKEQQADEKTSGMEPRIQHEIGKHLRAHYDDVINEPIPDRFMELLEQLERSARKD